MNPNQEPVTTQPQQPSFPPAPPPPVVPSTQPSMPPAQPVQPPVQPSVPPEPIQAQPAPSLNTQPEPDMKAQKAYASPNPGMSFAIASIVLLFFGLGLLSVIFGAIGLRRSRRAGRSNGLAIAGMVLGSLEIIAFLVVAALFGVAALTVLETCNEYGSGTHVLTTGQTITCSL